MRVITTTDNKYLGMQVPTPTIGDTFTLDGCQFNIEFIHALANGDLCVGNNNYQFELSQE